MATRLQVAVTAICCVLMASHAALAHAEAAASRRLTAPGGNNGNGNAKNGNGRPLDGTDKVAPGEAAKLEKQKIKKGAEPDAVNLMGTNPFDDEGVAIVEGEVRGGLTDAST